MDGNGNRNGIISMLEKQGRAIHSAKASGSPDAEDENEYTAFANGRVGTRPQLSVIFRKADGSAKAFAYTHLYSIETDNPDTGFVAEFTQTKVKINGRNLEPLFRFFCQHRALEVIEAERNQVFELAAADPVIENIEFEVLTL